MNIKETYYLDIFLKKTYKNLGQFTIADPNATIVGSLSSSTIIPPTSPTIAITQPRNIFITGTTESRLNEVRTYNFNEPYKIGVKGVTGITSEYIEYIIGGIYYKTFLSSNTTYFEFTKTSDILDQKIIIADNNSIAIDVKKTLNAMVIDRSNISVYNYFNKINNCSSLDDILEIF